MSIEMLIPDAGFLWGMGMGVSFSPAPEIWTGTPSLQPFSDTYFLSLPVSVPTANSSSCLSLENHSFLR